MDDKKEETPSIAPVLCGEEEEAVTLGEIVETIDYLEDKADVLFATQNPNVCTYAEGYKPRQTLFTCLTCTPAPEMAGVCYGCALNCHDGHIIVELYTKRKFKCDCGNSKFGEKKCALYEDKDAKNEYNMYNHNYNGKFCTCDVFYPDEDGGKELLQCEICEDWFHEEHMPFKDVNYYYEEIEANSDTILNRDIASAVCLVCIKKLPFLMHMKSGKDVFCHSKLIAEETKPEPHALCIEHFRAKLCKCADCVRVYEMADCEFLLDDEDDIATFDSESRKKVEENKTTEDDEMREMVKQIGMDGAQHFYSEVHNFKRKLEDFLNTKAEGGRTIAASDIKTFFDALKEENLEKKRARYE
ncbi:UBR-type domain-containing protein [Caenorhabditis elegans]|uniref:UBR-type domain-containing protein n=1 Tax=Caenorhabditis elegans TaxID=6239 RepID=Q22662_CAEEL|nr:UBR-type domain-containing protein [Caenorhabditis elegans]CAA99920.2 UBR-type domain-containing protein [Caenorhabditis elegans]|eukprot:NP_492187.2 Uncharacterized protein CELE_T22C1.1 [Caenorhabditis elegans]